MSDNHLRFSEDSPPPPPSRHFPFIRTSLFARLITGNKQPFHPWSWRRKWRNCVSGSLNLLSADGYHHKHAGAFEAKAFVGRRADKKEEEEEEDEVRPLVSASAVRVLCELMRCWSCLIATWEGDGDADTVHESMRSSPLRKDVWWRLVAAAERCQNLSTLNRGTERL